MTDAKNAIKEKKKLIIDESPLDDNINEIYPSIESKDDEIVHTLENTIDNLKILTEVNRIRILKKIYPKIQEYLKNWRSTFADAEECEKKSKAAAEANVASTAKVEETKKGEKTSRTSFSLRTSPATVWRCSELSRFQGWRSTWRVDTASQ